MGCGKLLIRVGDIWYGEHNSQTCGQEMLSTEIITDVQNTEEVILPDFIDVKAEEIYDVVDDSDIDNDIFNDAPNALSEECIEYIEQQQPSDELQQPYSIKQLKKDVKLKEQITKGTAQLTSLTEDQLQSRVCPICNKMIVSNCK